MNMDASKVLRLPTKIKSSSENDAKVARLSYRTTYDTLSEIHRNVTKYHALHTKRRNNTHWNLRNWEVFAVSHIGRATPPQNQRIETRHVKPQNEHFIQAFLILFNFVYLQIDVFLRIFPLFPKSATSKSMFRVMPCQKNAMLATEFARCPHSTQPWQCSSQKHGTRHAYSLTEFGCATLDPSLLLHVANHVYITVSLDLKCHVESSPDPVQFSLVFFSIGDKSHCCRALTTAGLGSKTSKMEEHGQISVTWHSAAATWQCHNPGGTQLATKCCVHTSGLMRIVKRIRMATWFRSTRRWPIRSWTL